MSEMVTVLLVLIQVAQVGVRICAGLPHKFPQAKFICTDSVVIYVST